MSSIPENRTEILCETKEEIHQRWQSAVKWSSRNPSFGITFNESLVNNTLFSNRPFNISQFPFHQQCTVKHTQHNNLNDTYCSANIKPDCQLLQNYRNNLTCPFSTDGKTNEECECIGLKKKVNEMKSYDQVNCTCMHDNIRGTMNNKGNCEYNYFFTKECIIDRINVSGANSFQLNCTFINCSSTFENEFFNATADEPIYEPCMDYRPVKIKPHIIEKRTTTTTTTTTATTTTAKTKKTSATINSTTNSTTSKGNVRVANTTIPSRAKSSGLPTLNRSSTKKPTTTLKIAFSSTQDLTKSPSKSLIISTATEQSTTVLTTASKSTNAAKPLTSGSSLPKKPLSATSKTTQGIITIPTTSSSKTSTTVNAISAKSSTLDKNGNLTVTGKSDPTLTTIQSLNEPSAFSHSISAFSLSPIGAQHSTQTNSGSIAGIMIFLILVFSALGFTGFLLKTRKGQELNKRIRERFTQQ